MYYDATSGIYVNFENKAWCSMYYDVTSRNYVNAENRAWCSKDEIVSVLREFGKHKIIDSWGNDIVTLSEDYSSIVGDVDEKTVNSISCLIFDIYMSTRMCLGLFFLAMEKYTGCEKKIVFVDHRFIVNSIHTESKNHIRQVLNQLQVLGLQSFCEASFLTYILQEKYDAGFKKAILFKLFELGLDVELRNSSYYAMKVYADYVRELTLFNLLALKTENLL